MTTAAANRKNFTFEEAAEYLVAAKVVESAMSIGSNREKSSIELPAGGIDKRPNGYFHRSDLNRLISHSQQDRKIMNDGLLYSGS